MVARTRRPRRPDPAPANGFLVPVGTPRWFHRLTPMGIVVVGEQGRRCAILTGVEHQDVHRALLNGARNLRLTARDGAAAFSEASVLGEMARHLPTGFRMGSAQPVHLRDVHGTGRIRFSNLVGGLALDDEVEAPPPAGSLAAPPAGGIAAPSPAGTIAAPRPASSFAARSPAGSFAERPPPGFG